MGSRFLALGNEAMAHALVENGCRVASSYPGTPASEILSSVAKIGKARGIRMHAEWAVNEKVAFEIAYTGSLTGLRTAVSMKQVGLSVASDPLMSAAYTGVAGGFLVISADDPGPHSSQTEQDSRLLAMMAKVPVLDPASPAEAMELIAKGYELSERFRIPVMLRPTTRVCHACQDIAAGEILSVPPDADFRKDPARWAATPAFRLALHRELAEKIAAISSWAPTAPRLVNPGASGVRAVVASGVAAAHAREILPELGLWDRVPLYQVLQPYPLHSEFVSRLLASFEEILVLEEPAGVIEMQFLDRSRVRGKMTGAVPEVGELLPETVERILARFAGLAVETAGAEPQVREGRRPTLCAGCSHRAAFYAIRKAAPKGIYPSDIGCYTLGLNLGGVDTVLCMGAAVSQAAGFYQAYRLAGKTVDIVATIGDSTFYHAGIPPLIDAVVQGARFVLVILDNATTAMTGFQPTPATGTGAAGEPTAAADMEAIVRGCGVGYCKVGVPGRLPEFVALLQEALAYSRERGPAVVIAREPCAVMERIRGGRLPGARSVSVTDACTGCRHCITHFECPALRCGEGEERAQVDGVLCTGCGVCIDVCPVGAIQWEPVEEEGSR
ncbi:MAG: indolepyruvate oxidoreductase [Deltaproteobacteria bacterium GWC2_65_14]|nr:MAG: indolepyruvate oxidoreductase [Deltaproteobacteria bacterium GWC2_65_14]